MLVHAAEIACVQPALGVDGAGRRVRIVEVIWLKIGTQTFV